MGLSLGYVLGFYIHKHNSNNYWFYMTVPLFVIASLLIIYGALFMYYTRLPQVLALLALPSEWLYQDPIRILTTSPPLSCAMAGISELLSAENQASQIVVEARAGGFIITTRLDMQALGRGERMKEARLEAEAFINEVRSEKESTFQLSSIKVGFRTPASAHKVTQNRDQDEALDIERDTNLSLAAMKQNQCSHFELLPPQLPQATIRAQ